MMMGDFNSRTGSLQDFTGDDSTINAAFTYIYLKYDCNVPRQSYDSNENVNSFW